MKDNGQNDRALGVLLGGAVGDALGWPQEQNAGNVDRQRREPPLPEFQFRDWTRYSGGRFYPHHERIGPGEYSDDTQLVLATARSLLRGEAWLDWFTTVELPLLLLYERGAGRAVKRASASWLRNRPPWMATKSEEASSYFNAGGNGAAMRVAPHCLRAAKLSVRETLGAVVRDAICTHGHPRALLGASVQAYAVSSLFQRHETLAYGELVDELLSSVDVWGSVELVEKLPDDWTPQFVKIIGETPSDVWAKTVGEMVDLLKIVAQGLAAGTLGDDEDTLASIGCFDRAVNGAGTVSAAASVFLASKSAANPAAGLLQAAFLHDADTDTVASMTGALLGALRGIDWLGDLGKSIQDAASFRSIARDLTGNTPEGLSHAPDRITRNLIDRFTAALEEGDASGEPWAGVLPDGRRASVIAPLRVESLSPKLEVRGWVIALEDDQSIFVKKLKRIQVPQEAKSPRAEVARIGVKILSSDLHSSRTFYEHVLGLEPARSESNLVNYGEVLTIVQRVRGSATKRQLAFDDLEAPVMVYLELAPIDEIFDRARTSGAMIVVPLGGRGPQFFRCLDPDGTVLEIREALRGTGG